MVNGFTSYEGDAKLYKVTWEHGTDFVHAPSESIALMRYKDKYPNRKIKKIERA